MRILKVLIELCAYYIERLRLYTFLKKNGAAYVVTHRDEWKAYAGQNWASRYLKK